MSADTLRDTDIAQFSGNAVEFSTGLSKAELERLAILSEECGEVQQCIGKILRHGYEEYSPTDETKTTNRKNLEREIGDLMFAMFFLLANKDVSSENIEEATVTKSENIEKYLHFNKLNLE